MQKSLVVIIVVFLFATLISIIGFILNGKAIFSNSRMESILISKDKGETWEKARGLGRINVSEFYQSREYPGRIYVLTNGGIWVGEDGGKEWKKIPLFSVKKGALIHSVAESGNGELFISFFQGRQSHIIKYNLKNAGEQEIYFTPLPGYGIFGIEVDFLNENILRLASSDGGFYESANKGFSWRAIKRFQEGILQLISDRKNPGKFWIRTSKGKILETFDNGRNWIDISLDFDKFDGSRKIENFVFDQNSGFLYVASDYGLLRSRGGNRWETVPLLVPPEALPIKAVAVDPKNPDIIYAGTKNQFYKSFDDGHSWRISRLPTGRSVSRIIVDFLNPDIIYVGLK
jgi:photosystem II stability/assembly factor-like uncharacterized protein